MKTATGITCVFLDIGDVLLTDGWDHLARRRAARNFKLEWAEMGVACPVICTSEIVSVAQREVSLSRRSRGCGKVGSVVCFPLFHAPCCL
uniref:Uncharacterized protein n=1 Tax=mine drainage metagenome TaxID=410659 RepID=E6QKJ4_9ZZZZ